MLQAELWLDKNPYQLRAKEETVIFSSVETGVSVIT